MSETPLKICPECLTSLYMSYSACPYCDAPKDKEHIDILLEKRGAHQRKVLLYAIIGLFIIGATIFALDHFLPAICHSCSPSVTGYSIGSTQKEVAFLEAAFNP